MVGFKIKYFGIKLEPEIFYMPFSRQYPASGGTRNDKDSASKKLPEGVN